ncbi:MAG: hypothetical protein CL466_00695 [Acidimicrobiaceae bacterium]|nr:hypothetical protein [Acidimicrobiaceae bacterium]|tara:strand:- start:43 stop:558 length:516 start_codon:yes stop_codon:yes gene_type:complete
MNEERTIDTVPVAHTPAGGWAIWPPPVLVGCSEPTPADAPDLDGYWRTVEVLVDDQSQPNHPALHHVQRVEQRGDRLVVTGGGVIHDMRCDGTLERGVHDVAEFDKATEIHVVASYEDGVHVLRPEGLPIEVRRRREGSQMVWDYVGFTARLEFLAPSRTEPADVAGLMRD